MRTNIKEKAGQTLAIAGLLAERTAKYAAMIALPAAMFTALCILFDSTAGTVSAMLLIVAAWAVLDR